MEDERLAFIEISESEPAFQPYYAPNTIEEFFQINDLFRIFAKSLVFIHNRKDSSDWLVRTARRLAGNNYNFKFFQTHITKLERVLEEIVWPSDGTPEICVVDITNVAEDIGGFCESLARLKERTRGVWIRGYLWDISPSLMQLFDFLLFFDMSDFEFDILRTIISVSSEQVKYMRDYANRASYADVVLVFVNYEHLKDAPMFAYNPMTLLQIRGYTGLMDISPFIPLIIEATKFVFFEVSQWIDNIRQRAAQESAPPVGSTLPVTKEQFVAAASDPKSIASLLNQAATQADIDEIWNLLEQLKERHRLFRELELQEVTAAGTEAAKLRVEMQKTAHNIIKTVERLESALSRVYRSK